MYYLSMSVAGQNLSRIDANFKMIEIYLCKIIMVWIIFKRDYSGIYIFNLLQVIFLKFTYHQYRRNHIAVFQRFQRQRNHIHAVFRRVACQLHEHSVVKGIVELNAGRADKVYIFVFYNRCDIGPFPFVLDKKSLGYKLINHFPDALPSNHKPLLQFSF